VKIRELLPFVRKMLRGRLPVTMSICMLPLLAELSFRSAEAAVYSLMLYFGRLRPAELFSGSGTFQPAVSAVSMLLRMTVTAPLIYGAAVRLTELCSEESLTPLGDVLVSRRNFRRSLTAELIKRVLGLAALLPAAFFGTAAWRMLMSGGTAGDLFMTVHAFVLTAVSLGMWAALRIGLSALPYLMATYPERSVLRLAFTAMRLTRGRKMVLVKLAAAELPLALTVAGLPFALTRIMAGWALCISITVKEEEYNERDKAQAGVGKTGDPPELSYETAWGIPAAPDPAQAAGGRPDL
jgi:hypothetical protein